MSVRFAWSWALVAALAAVVTAGACSGQHGGVGSSGAGLESGSTTGGGGECLLGCGGGNPMSVLTLEPKTATIDVVDGMSMPVTFVAKLDGQEVFPGTWYVDRGDIASVTAKGVVTATNKKGGEVKIFAKHNNVVAQASAIVNFKKLSAGGVDAATQATLEAASGSDTLVWTYPYNGTVWPRGLLAPELMWNGGGANDTYLIRFSGSFLDLKIFTKAPPPSAVQISQDDWIALNETGNGNTVSVKVTRLAAGQNAAKVVADHKWTMAKGSMRGSVYYWVNNLGRVVRLKPGQPAPEDFLKAAGHSGCSTCHAVSANGQTLILGGDINVSKFDLLGNKATFSVTSVGKQIRNWAMPAISPDGKFLVENNAQHIPGPPGGNDGLYNTDNGQKVAGSGLDGLRLWMPAFAPKGHKLVYVTSNPNQGGDGQHDLAAYDFDLKTGKVGATKSLVAAAKDANYKYILFPSVSPTITNGESDLGKTWTVYHRGNHSSHDTRFGPGDLYLASVDTPDIEIRLANANGDSYPFAAGDRDRHNNYEPTFAPQASGGYMWVVFTSRRTYGNKLTAGSGQVKQLWMTAIDLNPEPNKDPSHPPFWVRGQDPKDLNMRAYWALDPCIQKGNMCKQDNDCCDGEPCINGQCGGPKKCAEIGQFCEGNGDCCDPTAKCIGQQCDHGGPN